MASPTPKRAPQPASLPDTVDPRWLLKAIAATIVAALACAYLTVCLLVWQGAWQLVLHPAAKIDRTPAVPFDTIHFDSSTTGKPRLTAWWIPASSTSPTILYLHDGTGNLAANVDRLTLLHNASLNVFALDYRGFGQSDGPHPTEARMSEDAAAALDYLLNTRHLAARQIIPQGVGLGATLAAHLAQAHPELPALILDDPDPTLATRVLKERGSTLIPVGLMLRDRFDLAPTLPTLTQPKLILLGRTPLPDAAFLASIPAAKMTVTLAAPGIPVAPQVPDHDTAYIQALQRFLAEYLPAH